MADLDSNPCKCCESLPGNWPCTTCEHVFCDKCLDKHCEGCERPGKWFCASCGCLFCESCWEKQLPHRKGNRCATGIPHERTDRNVARRLMEILTPPSDPSTQKQLHEMDLDTAWFGVVHRTNVSPVLNDYGRYSALMQDSDKRKWLERWPQIVSFIGQTGDGKSTLIKMLIDKEFQKLESKDDTKFPAPVVGTISGNTPTSGDVHLYADPRSFFQECPRLYADCEGLAGGETVPLGDRTNILQSKLGNSPAEVRRREQQKLRRKEWNIRWADAQTIKMRERAVAQLYPRFLYTFSNVIVFVLRNERTFEATALGNLLEWASKSIEGSINQPALPHAVVVLNSCDHLLPDEAYDVDKSTETLLTGIDESLLSNSALNGYIEYWKKNGRLIRNTKELICCYYSSFRVVRVPAKGRYQLLDDQISKLYAEIDNCCSASHNSRRHRRLDLNADELANSLENGFAHFANNLDRPFDFIEMSWNLNPIPQGFSGNILRLLLAIRETKQFPNGPEIFIHLVPMIVSCIMLDYVRHGMKGTPKQLLKHYEPSLDRALDEFCEAWWPCGYQQKNRMCVNTQRGHSKGHQDENGKLFGSGGYQSDFEAEDFRRHWSHLLTLRLEMFQRLLDTPTSLGGGGLEANATANRHIDHMNAFYGSFEDLRYFSNHYACFCCIREVPEYSLPCGHVLCASCIKSFGEKLSVNLFSLNYCPIHKRDKQDWDIKILLKPQYAGVRILALDGGGIRGIVELQTLAAIQRKLGELPIQSFFDLFVGTSTGGIIALGLGVKNWSVQECITKFKELCQSAFTPREFSNIPILKQLSILHHRAKYKTQPLENLLRHSFGEERLFGGCYQGQRSFVKVAVTSTTESGQKPLILSNYNRRQEKPNESYNFERPERIASEFKIWESARATSAAPSYFKPFSNPRTGRAYLDGALYHNNPILVADEERKVIWPDVEDLPPDIILSIGTGRNKKLMEKERRVAHRRRTGLPRHADDEESISDLPKKDLGFTLPNFLKVLQDRMTNMLDAQDKWIQFSKSTPKYANRRVRISPELEHLPALDEINQITSLENEVRSLLRKPQLKRTIDIVVLRLIASSFYFKKTLILAGVGLGAKGHIMCRFEDDRSKQQLAAKLQTFEKGRFSPYFKVIEDFNSHRESKPRIIPLSADVLSDMEVNGRFELPEEEISCSTQKAETMIELCFERSVDHVPISGFPRKLVYEDELLSQKEREKQLNARRTQSRNRPASSGNFSDLVELASETHAEDNRAASVRMSAGLPQTHSDPRSKSPLKQVSPAKQEQSSEQDSLNDSQAKFKQSRFVLSKNKSDGQYFTREHLRRSISPLPKPLSSLVHPAMRTELSDGISDAEVGTRHESSFSELAASPVSTTFFETRGLTPDPHAPPTPPPKK